MAQVLRYAFGGGRLLHLRQRERGPLVPGRFHDVPRILALAAIYVGAARLGLMLGPVNTFATAVWAPTGISLAALLLGGSCLWPGVALGAFVANTWIGAPLPVALGISAGNTLEAVTGAYLLRRFGDFHASLDRIRHVLALVGLGAMASTTISATVGVSSLLLGGLITRADLPETWRVWWLGDVVGVLVVAPLLLAWSGARRSTPAPRRLLEAAALGAGVIGASLVIFARSPPSGASGFLQACMLIPLLICGALRFGMKGATATVFLASVIAVAASAVGRGPFIQDTLSRSLTFLQAFMAIVAATTMVLGAVIAERVEALRRSRVAHHRCEQLGSLAVTLNAGRDQQEVLELGVREAARLLGADDDSLCLVQQDGSGLRSAFETRPAHRVGALLDLAALPHSRSAVDRRSPVYFTRAETAGTERAWLDQLGMEAALAIPLVTKDRLLGILYSGYRDGHRELSREDVELAQAIGGLCALALARAQDFEAEKAARQSLRRKENELRVITDATPVMFTRCGRDLRYRFVNRAYAAMLGRTPEEVIGRPIVELMGAEGYETIRPFVEAVLSGREVEYEEVVPFQGVGSRFLGVAYRPDKDEEGNVIGWLASISDNTGRKRAEAEVRSLAQFPEESPNPVMRTSLAGELLYANRPATQLLEEMGWKDGDPLPEVLLRSVRRMPESGAMECEVASPSDRVHSFTLSRSAGHGHVNLFGLDITERTRMERSLRDSERRKSEFLAVLSHELRNPLTPIRTAIHILHGAPAGSEHATRATTVIERQTNQLTRIVDDLLDVTRISQGKIQLHRSRIELTELVRHAVEDHRPIFASRGIALDLRIDTGPQWIDADATRITQVVGNLLQNAAKFTNAHGKVAVSVGGDGASRTEIRVVDDGIGIAPAMMPRIFEPFTQADESLHRGFGGLGLGLALVKGLVEMHGGQVEARSRGLGRGTEVTLSLPLLAGETLAPEAPLAEREPPSRLRVLVIEDNLDAAETLKEGLEMSGHEVAVAHDGEEGVARARAIEPDVVLCDIGLPGLNGYEVAQTLRADPGPSPTLIAITGYALPDDQRRALEAGFDRHLAKPFDFGELERLLASTLSKRR